MGKSNNYKHSDVINNILKENKRKQIVILSLIAILILLITTMIMILNKNMEVVVETDNGNRLYAVEKEISKSDRHMLHIKRFAEIYFNMVNKVSYKNVTDKYNKAVSLFEARIKNTNQGQVNTREKMLNILESMRKMIKDKKMILDTEIISTKIINDKEPFLVEVVAKVFSKRSKSEFKPSLKATIELEKTGITESNIFGLVPVDYNSVRLSQEEIEETNEQ